MGVWARIVTLAVVVALGSCAGSDATKATVALGVACDSYATTLSALARLRAQGSLTVAQEDQITRANAITGQACSSSSTLDPGLATQVVENQITLLHSIQSGEIR